MREAIIQIFCAGLGTLGFAFLFQVRRQHLLVATLGGALSWLSYLLVWELCGGVFLSTLVAAAVVCLWSETMARKCLAPASIFMLPGIVPLLPGGALFYTMSAIVARDVDQMFQKGVDTALIALGIAGGIVVGSEMVRLTLGVRRRVRKARAAKQKQEN